MDLSERVNIVVWYKEKNKKEVKEFFELVSRKFSPDIDEVSNQLNEITSKLPTIRYMLDRANAELDMAERRAFEHEDIPKPQHGNGKQRDAFVVDVCTPYRYIRNILEGLYETGKEKINYGKLILRKETNHYDVATL